MESSSNIVYTGAAPNQQIVPAIDYLLDQGYKKFFLLGSDYVFPRTANMIINAQLEAKGAKAVGEEYADMDQTDLQLSSQRSKLQSLTLSSTLLTEQATFHSSSRCLKRTIQARIT